MNNTFRVFTSLVLFLFLCSVHAGFVQRDGTKLKKDGAEIALQGICFGNYYEYENYSNSGEYDYIDLANPTHHNFDDYQNVLDMNLNSIRFGINGDWYVYYKSVGREEVFWTWLEDNLDWADAKGVLLILDMHLSPGDNWLDQSPKEEGFVPEYIWTNETKRNELIELWGKIAQKYSTRECIAAFDIVNEPVTSDNDTDVTDDGSMWTASDGLAQQLINTIRAHDRNHLIIIEPLYGVDGRFYIPESVKDVYPNVTDPLGNDNLMFDFHFYEPGSFTHQASTWTSDLIGAGGTYPDYYDFPEVYDYDALWKFKTGDYPAVYTGNNTDWVTKTGPRYTHPNYDVVFINAEFSIYSKGYNLSKDESKYISIDNLKLYEVDPKGEERVLKFSDVIDKEISMWSAWTCFAGDLPKGTYKQSNYVTIDTANKGTSEIDDASLIVNHLPDVNDFPDAEWKTENWYNGGYVMNLSRAFLCYRAKKDHSYYVTFDVKGDCGDNTEVQASLKTYSHKKDGVTHPSFLFRNKALMESWMQKKLQTLKDAYSGYPISITEYGVDRLGTIENNRGGKQWVKDFYDIAKENGVSTYTFWAYHNYSMGLYANTNVLPSENENSYPLPSQNHNVDLSKYSFYPRGEVQQEMINLITMKNGPAAIQNTTTNKWYDDLEVAIRECLSYQTIRLSGGKTYYLTGDVGVTASGITIEGSSTEPEEYPKIVGGNLNFTHSTVTLKRLSLPAISLSEHGPASIIENCTFTGNGISFAMINFSTIEGCTFENGASINLLAGRGNIVKECVFNGAATGTAITVNGNSLPSFSAYTAEQWRTLEHLDTYRTRLYQNTIKNYTTGVECAAYGVVKVRNVSMSDCGTGVILNDYSTADNSHFHNNAVNYVGTHGDSYTTGAPNMTVASIPCSGSPLIDAGVALEGFNDSFKGDGPDIGAKEEYPPSMSTDFCSCDVLFSEDFESFTLDSNLVAVNEWEFYVNDSAQAEAWILDQKVVGNKEAFFYVGKDGDETWSIHYRKTGLALEKGETYEVRFHARTELGYSRDIVVMLQQDLLWTDYSQQEPITIDDTMKEYTFSFTMNSASDFDAVFLIEMGDFDANGETPLDVILDNIRVTKVHP